MHLPARPGWHSWRFTLAWSLPVFVALTAWVSPWLAWAGMFGVQVLFALMERVPRWRHSPPAEPPRARHWLFLHGHVLLQAALLLWCIGLVHAQPIGLAGAVALGIAAGSVAGSQGITFAHELGHSRSRLDRALAWGLMTSVLYAHFMVEHYRGHHPRAATFDDPASARRGESLWRFLPRTLAGSWRSAWRLEARQLAALKRGWARSPLLWATAAQALLLVGIGVAFGPAALLFWLVQAAYAVFLLEGINYIEHYGLVRQPDATGKPEPFAMQHAWNADHLMTNSVLVNLQRHSDHHLHAWKPYATLEPLPGPQLPTGYAGCLFMASVPRWWFRAMEPRLQRLAVATADPASSSASPHPVRV